MYKNLVDFNVFVLYNIVAPLKWEWLLISTFFVWRPVFGRHGALSFLYYSTKSAENQGV